VVAVGLGCRNNKAVVVVDLGCRNSKAVVAVDTLLGYIVRRLPVVRMRADPEQRRPLAVVACPYSDNKSK